MAFSDLGQRAGLKTIEVETKQFNKFVNDFISQSTLETGVIIRNMALDLLNRIVKKNPVLTGRSRAAWYMSVEGLGGQWSDQGSDKSAIAKGKSEGAFEDHTNSMPEKYVILINSVAYIIFLEYGASKQAPAGMVRLSMREMTGKVPQEIIDAYVATWNKNTGQLQLRKAKIT